MRSLAAAIWNELPDWIYGPFTVCFYILMAPFVVEFSPSIAVLHYTTLVHSGIAAYYAEDAVEVFYYALAVGVALLAGMVLVQFRRTQANFHVSRPMPPESVWTIPELLARGEVALAWGLVLSGIGLFAGVGCVGILAYYHINGRKWRPWGRTLDDFEEVEL